MHEFLQSSSRMTMLPGTNGTKSFDVEVLYDALFNGIHDLVKTLLDAAQFSFVDSLVVVVGRQSSVPFRVELFDEDGNEFRRDQPVFNPS